MTTTLEISESVQHYYGQVLQSSSDLKTSACCSIDAMPTYLKALLAGLHPEVLERFYGCGSPLPPALAGMTVLDLGCGTGRDCYLLSTLVGPTGRVIGVDMTPEQLEVAVRHREWHAERFGFANVEFLHGHIENLHTVGIADNSIDVVVSNCVINLSPEKPKVLAEIFRVLKPGGELYFSDVFADRRIPSELRQDPVLLGECLGGALYWEDFRRILQDLGCPDVRKVKQNPISIDDPEVFGKIGMVKFDSVTVRAFKMPLEDRCEDFGQVAVYLGSIEQHPHSFELDDHHHFETGRPLRVCGNTADMLAASRYGRHFQVLGDKSTHFGLFDCVPGPRNTITQADGACC
ncbi:methyltransferase domain-containing protein [Methylomonas sp. LW13]|uniref:methyltransferase domain-containing protein n=1 Tax=unclassified Methylomonas TaxID=2608980 RepID=UPI00051B7563|nr:MULTISPECIES: methyltransferase domain-containing protein [unclassified Methylomonas]PKD39642.1 methyltransferase domain-containing protein [Methylomonas sp. Kb3]QBC27737.1 methyltransferase domain-containing protein [Methylomonas sp. LW13]